MLNIRDRTTEFQRSVIQHSKRSHDVVKKQSTVQKSQFQQQASVIAHEIAQTAQLLGKLAQLAKRKPMLNDNPVEIAELTYVVKRKIYAVEQNMLELAKMGGNQNASSQPIQHTRNVVNLLNTKMKNISGDFKSVLEQRQRLELANRDRWEQLSAHTESEQHHTYNNSNPFMSSVLDEGNGNEGQLTLPQESQMLLLEEQTSSSAYLQERNRAVETIESTIQEVGNLFQQLAHMVQEQGEVIQRIDANVDDIDLNISGAQRELLKYFDRVSSNRWLAVKIFAVLFVFFLVWVLVN
ncbi:LANO_0D07712g1_1 [Lachancea nothofagi CBS 11611]|uniref:LANO_0D07712g1_1 n=1 Tax=Lachancea nothofagi CBS 11611 TaxID=1266666 RepID=A0A1G4JI91_9SACH|nr:LANO_0D07712g1_1 [Lachancea nothofagi CBS 11611]